MPIPSYRIISDVSWHNRMRRSIFLMKVFADLGRDNLRVIKVFVRLELIHCFFPDMMLSL
jgi:hypothetical protein